MDYWWGRNSEREKRPSYYFLPPISFPRLIPFWLEKRLLYLLVLERPLPTKIDSSGLACPPLSCPILTKLIDVFKGIMRHSETCLGGVFWVGIGPMVSPNAMTYGIPSYLTYQWQETTHPHPRWEDLLPAYCISLHHLVIIRKWIH